MRNPIIFIGVTAIVVGAGGFYGGIMYQQAQKIAIPGDLGRTGTFQRGGAGGPNRQGVPGIGERPVSGEITAVDATTLTLKLADGSTKIVVYGDSTRINKTSDGSKSDLKVGEKVMAIGSQGDDGTVSAQSISLGGNFVMGGPTKSN